MIRRYQFDLPGAKVEVRRQVQVSAYPTLATGGEAFVEGSPTSRRSFSFDEPLASALLQADGFADRSKVGTVLPMLPNGNGHSAGRMTSIPIRGMSESLGRLRREMMVARKKGRGANGTWRRASGGGGGEEGMSMSVPLEFDEDEEDFSFHAPSDEERMRDESSGSRGEENLSSSTPATSLYPMDMDPEEDRGGVALSDDVWNDGWGVEDKKAIEEVEMYDHISAVGLLDEEHEMDRRMQEEKEAAATAAALVAAPSKVRYTKSEKKRKGKKI